MAVILVQTLYSKFTASKDRYVFFLLLALNLKTELVLKCGVDNGYFDFNSPTLLIGAIMGCGDIIGPIFYSFTHTWD